MNYACIYVPDFLAQAVTRGEPALRDRPVAILDGVAPLATVVGVNAKARAAGVEVGMTRQASQFPSVELRQRSPAQEEAAHAGLLDGASAFSPCVEDAAADTVLLNLYGMHRLFRSTSEMARRLARSIAQLGLKAHVAVACNPDAARHAARGFPGITLVPPGKEAACLGVLPVEVLAPPPEVLETLRRWGVHALCDLARLPTEPLSERLGQEGVRLQQLARGVGLRPLVRTEPSPSFEEVMEMEYPVELLDPLLFILGRLLNQLCVRLAARALAAQELCLRLEVENTAPHAGADANPAAAKAHERRLRLPVPMRDPKTFLKLLQLRLKAHPLPGPVVKVAVAAQPAKPRVAQGGLFLPLAPDPEKLEVTLARLAALVGEGNVGSPELLDTHRPGAFRMRRFNPLNRSLGGGSACSSLSERRHRVAPMLALRVFRPPLRATVEVRGGHPARVSAFGVRGDVVFAAGPWRSSGDWWRENPWEYDEWDVELAGRLPAVSKLMPLPGAPQRNGHRARRTALYCIYRDRLTGEWFVQGSYD